MHIPKRYGQSKMDSCPFCGKIGTTKNSQDIPVCQHHKDSELKDMRCVCGEWLDIYSGKWGPYFRCMNCGNISFKKGLEMNPQVKSEEQPKEKGPKEVTVTSDQVDFLY